MAAIVVPALDELRDQINEIAPSRDKASDGAQGDRAHSQRPSSHNGDRSGTPEWRDGDSLDEIRARDIDRDLNVPGLTMLMIVEHLVLGARAGRFWWLRYIIFDGVIYHKNTGWKARSYTGANKHEHHVHVNNDFTQKADAVRGVSYHLEEIPVALTDADKNWLRSTIATAVDARAAKTEAALRSSADLIAVTESTAKEINKKVGDKVSASILLQLAVIYAARASKKLDAIAAKLK
jgi:hypothetical protein